MIYTTEERIPRKRDEKKKDKPSKSLQETHKELVRKRRKNG